MKISSRSFSPERLERLAPWIFGVAAVAAAGLLLYLGRGTTYSADELPWVLGSPDLSIHDALRPYNGHLVFVSRVLYKLVLETFGSSYLPFRLMATAMVVLSSTLVFIYVRRRLGGLAALAPSIVLLVFGSDYIHVLVGNTITVLLALSCGLGAFLLLERGPGRGDIAACLLLCLGVITYSVALPFVVGCGAWLLSTPSRRRRIWIAAIPLVLYAAWWLWSLQFASGSEGQLALRNVLLIPTWAVQSFGAVIAALTGAGYNFGTEPQLGPILGILAAAGLGWRLRRPVTPTLVAWIVAALGLAAIEVLVRNFFSSPDIPRYFYSEAIIVIVLAAEAARDIDWTPHRHAMLGAVAIMGIGANLILLVDGSKQLRDQYTPRIRAELTGLELSGPGIVSDFQANKVLGGQNGIGIPLYTASFLNDSPSRSYVEATNRYGSIGYTEEELISKDEGTREVADAVLGVGLQLELGPPPAAPEGCRLLRGSEGLVDFPLPRSGTVLTALDRDATVQARRFGDTATVPVGTLPANQPMLLSATPADLGRPWRISVAAGSIRMCGVR